MSYDSKPATGSGTSFSAALVTGAAALLLVVKPDLPPREIKNLLYTSSGKWSFSASREGQCFGMVNINTAMGNLLAKKTTPEKIVINKPAIEMYAGTDTSIEYAIYPGNTNTTDVTFTSSNENVAKVDADGIVTAVAPGKATIRLISKAVSAKCNVTVKEIPYQTIDQKPYRAEGTITLNDMTDIVEEMDENNVPVSQIGFLLHRYHVNLKKSETIDAVMSSEEHYSFLRIKNKDNMVVASGDVGAPKSYSRVTYTAEQAGTYQLQTCMQINRLSWPNKPAADYALVLTSDKSFCEPTVDSIDNGEMHMSWPAVDNANGYYVRKYADKGLTELEFEDKISKTEYTDTAFDKNKANYYSVTSYVETKAGELHNGVTPLVIKMQNPMTAKAKVKTVKVKAKKLKKKSVKIKRTKYLKITNAKGKLTYTKVKGKKKITVSKKTGRLKIKKGLKKGKYTVKVKIRDAGNEEYNAATRTVTFKVRVK